jgi:phosphatidylglycerophosphate synthase
MLSADTTRVLLFATSRVSPPADGSAVGSADGGPDAGPTAMLPVGDQSAVDRLVGQLRQLGEVDVTVVTRPGWAAPLRAAGHSAVESEDVAGDLAVIGAAVTAAPGTVVLAAADLVAHRSALAPFVGARVRRTVAAVQTAGAMATGAYGQPVRRERDMIVSAGTNERVVTDPNAVFRGIVAVGAADRTHLHDACAALRTEAIDSRRDLDADAGGYGAVGLALLGLVRTGVVVGSYNARLFVCRRVDSPDSAREAASALAAVDEPAAAIRMGIKEDDEFLATYLVHSYTPRTVAFFARRGITPNQVTWMSIGVGVVAAIVFALGVRWLDVVGAVLLYASFILDCNDGSLARYTGNFSRYGGWLDMIADRAKEYLVFAGLAIGGSRMHEPGIWGLAIAALVAQTVRHMVDTWYGALQDTATRALPVVPLGSPLDRLGLGAAERRGGTPAATAGARLGQLSAAAHGSYRSPAYWLKRSVVLPIGDRWLLMAVAVAIAGPRVMFIVLLIAIALAFAYVLVGRTLRALSMRIAPMPRYDIRFQRDDGVIARLIGRLSPVRARPLPAIVPGLAGALIALGLAIAGHPGPRWIVLVLAVLALIAALGSGARHDGTLDWLTVAGLRATEYTFITVAGILGGVPLWLVYTLLFALTMYHYDITGRIEKQATPVRGEALLRGWDVRITILAVATTIGWATPAYAVGAAVIAGVLIIGALYGWWQSARTRSPSNTTAREAALSK